MNHDSVLFSLARAALEECEDEMEKTASPLDPAVAAQAAVPPVPSAAPPDPAMMAQLQQALPQVLQQMGVGGAGGGKGKGGEMEERVSALEAGMAEVFKQLGMANPEQELASTIQQQGAAPGAAQGAADPMAAGVAPAGPMDPNAAGVLGELKTAALDLPILDGFGHPSGFPASRAANAICQIMERVRQ